MCSCYFFFFFFKQKTAYDMRISDWSSDVCSSDLLSPDLGPPLESLRRLVMDGGKRLRPAFCFWAYYGAGGDPDSTEIIDAGAAFEMQIGRASCRERVCQYV